ncbi:N(2)-acetyl-L-2,4-diaminobutanoate deacetylase DoeB [Qingshengfaniella alkalisoli]|uniref:N-alpha-acetyl diaminobutyric acid deacetylase DoeB n=1 Tax=Qingshengfaniella alkalisoli TaxID=2599296 RepID=A0A5B8J6Z3_9RHOB|nr:N(2)-acetyl-L-2,4-diaminobutanoate deacetylase DoeB [Qingshengfaniella alkalisoli]QDY70100.1 N-alpha-acetyl diaminobutyric acid deacetylase DoeB [Qingshengfaniella alkalisoli]
MTTNPITPTVPFDDDGKYHGFLRLPHSRNESAWGAIMIPITVIRNGDGPTALLTGANHGDEYEGPVALQSLAWELEPEDIAGRVIIVPYMNYPAFRSATRVSPIDNVNLNRAFPGAPDGTATMKIADYFENTLVPMADIVLDYHSGGKTLDFIPFACAHYLDSQSQQDACVAAVTAFNAPYTMMLREIDSVGMYDTSVEAQGKVFVTTELGGGGSATARSSRIAKKGARNVLIHAGILGGEPIIETSSFLDMPSEACYHFATSEGLLEPTVDLGDQVAQGDLIARVWPADRTGVVPLEYYAQISGVLAARHFPGLIQTGDCLAVIGTLED